MDKHDEILISLGRIEGRLIGIERLMDRVTKVETSVAWLKGGWAILVAGLLFVFKAG